MAVDNDFAPLLDAHGPGEVRKPSVKINVPFDFWEKLKAWRIRKDRLAKQLKNRLMKRLMRRLMLAAAFAFMSPTFAQAEDPSPYKGINFQWEYGDYAIHSGFNIYQVGTTEPIVKITDRTKRYCYHLMPLTIGQSMCFTMDAVDNKGNKSEMSKEACIIVPLPGVESFLVFPGVK